MQTEAPKNLRDLLTEVGSVIRMNDDITGANALVSVLRKYHYWPALQVKKFFKEPNLVLLHNTYKRVDVHNFQELYDECRSVILDMNAPEGENVIVTYANSIADRMNDKQYEKIMDEADVCEESFEGTVVTVYHYKNTWYFGTTSCPVVDSSRYFHPTKTHGDMLNEALLKLFPDTPVESVRDKFTEHLNKECAYAFCLVHHENRHLMNYTTVFGDEYAKLVHLTTRNRHTLQEEKDMEKFKDMGIIYPRFFMVPEEARDALLIDNFMYAFIVTKADGKKLKVSRDFVIHHEENDLGNPNKWHNMLWLYMQNKKEYQVSDYQRDFAPNLEVPLDKNGLPMAPTYLIHTVMCNMRDVLYALYRDTTTYNVVTNHFKMNKEKDESYHPMLRFHLAQLRRLQVSDHANRFITPKSVYDYLCHHHTLKNIRLLIKYFAETPAFFKPRTAECFKVLNEMLTPVVKN